MSTKPVLLRHKITQASEPFEAEHAKRLLAYPGSHYEAITEATEKGAGELQAKVKPEKPALAVAAAAAEATEKKPK